MSMFFDGWDFWALVVTGALSLAGILIMLVQLYYALTDEPNDGQGQ